MEDDRECFGKPLSVLHRWNDSIFPNRSWKQLSLESIHEMRDRVPVVGPFKTPAQKKRERESETRTLTSQASSRVRRVCAWGARASRGWSSSTSSSSSFANVQLYGILSTLLYRIPVSTFGFSRALCVLEETVVSTDSRSFRVVFRKAPDSTFVLRLFELVREYL